MAFSASSNEDMNATTNGSVRLNVVHADVGRSFRAAASTFTTPAIGIYFVELCFGIPRNRSVRLSIGEGGRSTRTTLIWEPTKQYDGPETRCREGLAEIEADVTQYLSLNDGTLSNRNLDTSLTVFSVTDAMTDYAEERILHAVSRNAVNGIGTVPLTTRIRLLSNVFDFVSSKYTCTSTGLYMFSFSGGFASTAVQTTLALQGLDRQFELGRRASHPSGSGDHKPVASYSRTILNFCKAGTQVYLNVTSGSVINPEDYELTTLFVVPYVPAYNTPAAWSLLRDINCVANVSKGTETVGFNIVAYNDQSLWNSTVNTVTIKSPGYYYVYFSSGVTEKCLLNMSVVRNREVLLRIVLTICALNKSEEIVGRGAIFPLKINDILAVVANEKTFIYSNKRGNQAVFFGMLLYPAEPVKPNS